MQRVLLIALLAGCVPTSYAYTPASGRSFPKRAEGCTFDMLTTPPQKDFEEVGTLVHYNGDLPKNLDKLKSIIANQVCSVGGDAAIAVSDDKGYSKVTVIAWPKPFTPGQ
jgi:hypothetical protein